MTRISKYLKILTLNLFILLSNGCSLHPILSHLININVNASQTNMGRVIHSPNASLMQLLNTPAALPSAPPIANDFDCLAVSVTGGANPQLSDSTITGVPWDCLNLGSVSKLVTPNPLNTPTPIGLQALSGPALHLQLLGISTGGAACSGMELLDLLRTSTPALFEVGSTDLQNVYQDGSTVTINDSTYVNAPTELFESCFQSNVADTFVNLLEQPTGAFVQLIAYSTHESLESPFTAIIPDISNSVDFTPAASGNGIVTSLSQTAGNYARVDLALQVTNSNALYQLNQLTINIDAEAGLGVNSGGCSSSTTLTSGNGYTARVWLGSAATPAWSSANITTSTYTNEQQTLTLDSTTDVSPSLLWTSESVGYGLDNYIHISLQSNDTVTDAATQCLLIKLNSIQVGFNRYSSN